MFLLLPVDYDLERNRQFICNTVDAAKNVNVKLLVINTNGFVPDDATGVAAIEIKRELIAYVKQSGIPSIFLQPTLYGKLLGSRCCRQPDASLSCTGRSGNRLD